MNAADFIEILKVVNIMDEVRFWAVWSTVSVTALGWVASKIVTAVKGRGDGDKS